MTSSGKIRTRGILMSTGLFGAAVGIVIVGKESTWNRMVLLVGAALLAVVFTALFAIIRHFQLSQRRRKRAVHWSPRHQGSPARERSEDYYLFVLGSGGHTKEMLMMMDDGFCQFQNFHRRYLISSGDSMSMNHLTDYENDLKALAEKQGHSCGTYDTRVVARARHVHQSLLTTPWTALISLYHILGVLLSSPASPVGQSLVIPRLIFSNGPATSFFVGLAVHLLKIFYVIPEEECLFIYIESWARISTLSLTGKLFHYTGIADAFAVQHQEVAKRYGVDYAGPLVFNSRRP